MESIQNVNTTISSNLHKSQTKIKLEAAPNTKLCIGMIVILVLFIASLVYIQVSLIDIIIGFPSFVLFFFEKFPMPNFENVNQYIPLMMETIYYAVVATVFSTFIALGFSILMSKRTNHIEPLRYAVRGFMAFFRTVPVIILASVLVYIFGIGAISGILALIFTTLAFLSRAFAESLDDIDEGKLEALEAVGASKVQVFVECIIPNFTPVLLDWALYIFQINILASILLGLVGAGGIGMQVQNALRLFQYHTAFAILLIIIAMVVATELITNKLRKMIR